MTGLAWASGGFALALALGVGPSRVVFAGGGSIGPSAAAPVGERVAGTGPGVQRKAFDEAVSLVLDDYVDHVEVPRVLGRALSHMVAGLDSHSVYLDAAARSRWQTQRERGLMTGMQLRANVQLDGAFEIEAVMPGSAAEQAGLKPGERVLAIDDQAAIGFAHPLLAQIAATPVDGGEVDLAVRGLDGKIRNVELTAQRVESVRAVESQMLIAGPDARPDARRKKIGSIRIHAFLPGVADQVRRALAELHRAGGGRLDGLVLDLRGNPGGDVQEALRVAELFVSEGVLVRTRGRDHSIRSEELAHSAGTDLKLKLAIVLDEGSASAAELLAAALHAHSRATLLGRTSHGKGTVQRLYGLPDGSQLRLTVARYYGPDDRQIDGRGLTPDIPLTLLEMNAANAHAWAYLAGN